MAIVDGIKVTSKNIKIDEFLKFLDNPKQRDTVRHAKKASNRHLSELSATQLRVAAAVLGKKTYVLDGHTRRYMWDMGLLERPNNDVIQCEFYEVKNIDQVIELYDHFDNAAAVENIGDKLSGAFRYHKMGIVSRFWWSGGITTALKCLYNGGVIRSMAKVNILDPIGLFKDAILKLDTLNLQPRHFNAPMLAAALITVQKDKGVALSFWDAYNQDLGKKNAKSFDPVFAMSSYFADLKHQKLMTRGSQNAILEFTPTFIEIYETWAHGETRLQKIPKSKDVLPVKFNNLLPKVLEKTPYYFVIQEQYLTEQ